MARLCKLSAIPLVAVAILVATAVRAEVHISPDLPVVVTDQVLVNPASWIVIEVGRFTPGRQIKANLNFVGGTGDLAAAIVDEANLNFFRQGLPFRAYRAERRMAPIQLVGTTWSHGRYYLLFDNRHAVLAGRQVSFRIDYMEQIDPAAQRQLKEQMELIFAALKEEFVFPDFNIHVTPCGQANAFSSPDITLCIELMMELVQGGRGNALMGVFLHELAHTLLNIWGMPGYDNEDIADEFAAVVLLNDDKSDIGGQVLSDMITWFSQQDSKAQAVAILAQGDRHAPSIQRVRNLERIMANPAPVITRWNRLLYQHMTANALERIASQPGTHDDPQLARQVLALRGPQPRQ